MAAKSRTQIIDDIEDCIGRNGGNFGEWYVGFTANPKVKLFSGHKLKEKGDAWISRLAKDEVEAHEVAEFFRTTRKTKGPGGQPGDNDLYVYAYKMKSHTKP
ncbi:hypothetical protein WV31_18880 [Magnetospirillum sp. ME-1]|uniref:hypothetical protein n=1 Tax=Magnetospirillum sp. ME-1 TaxID=1639348 RepID=UPI000A17BE37|nr:hypothetical protein [Magnetospirillum sp. ME-1]ARJ67575.1 hypothetical protein WV31_18880 [Magnetospirillum sp. ME-1]